MHLTMALPDPAEAQGQDSFPWVAQKSNQVTTTWKNLHDLYEATLHISHEMRE